MTQLAALVDRAQEDRTLGVMVASRLSGAGRLGGGVREAAITKLLSKLDADGVLEYLSYLQGLFSSPAHHKTKEASAAADEAKEADDDEEEEEEDSSPYRFDGVRQWAVDQIVAILRNRRLPVPEPAALDVLAFLIVNGFFVRPEGAVKKAAAGPHTRHLEQVATPAVSVNTAEVCRKRLYVALAELLEHSICTCFFVFFCAFLT